MEFFINEIIEDSEIKKLLLSNREMREKAKAVVEDIKTGNIPVLEKGIFPLFVLGFLADYALSINNDRGIPKNITIDTLKDVNIWIANYKNQYNVLGLGEFNWLRNHYMGTLFRLGRLQFKLAKSLPGVPSGEYAIETHIPQGEPLNIEDCLLSFEKAKKFFKKFYPDKKPQYFMCDSWLLNPNLEKVLTRDSNIVKFMKLWTQFPFKSDGSNQAIKRVFGFEFDKTNLMDAPENTKLQKSLKEFLLGGGSMDITAGWRKI